VGASLLAKAACQSIQELPGPASSLASQLPQDFVVNAVIENNADTCGSWLASGGGGRFTIDVN
jgi:hypothetical protein